MRTFTVVAVASVLALSVAAAYAHEPPQWISEVQDTGGPPSWVDDVKTDGGPPAFVETASGTTGARDEILENVRTNENVNEGASSEDNANTPEWVAQVKADGGPPAWVEVVKANGGPPPWVADVRTTPAAATEAAKKKAGR